MTCPTVHLAVPYDGDALVFDCATEDEAGNRWVYTSLVGWYEPPAPVYSTFPLGGTLGDEVTRSTWAPRQITLGLTNIIGSGNLDAALDSLVALSNMLSVPGRLTVFDNVPKYADVLLSDQPPPPRVVGERRAVEMQIPMVAYDVYRHRVSDDVGVL